MARFGTLTIYIENGISEYPTEEIAMVYKKNYSDVLLRFVI